MYVILNQNKSFFSTAPWSFKQYRLNLIQIFPRNQSKPGCLLLTCTEWCRPDRSERSRFARCFYEMHHESTKASELRWVEMPQRFLGMQREPLFFQYQLREKSVRIAITGCSIQCAPWNEAIFVYWKWASREFGARGSGTRVCRRSQVESSDIVHLDVAWKWAPAKRGEPKSAREPRRCSSRRGLVSLTQVHTVVVLARGSSSGSGGGSVDGSGKVCWCW